MLKVKSPFVDGGFCFYRSVAEVFARQDGQAAAPTPRWDQV